MKRNESPRWFRLLLLWFCFIGAMACGYEVVYWLDTYQKEMAIVMFANAVMFGYIAWDAWR